MEFEDLFHLDKHHLERDQGNDGVIRLGIEEIPLAEEQRSQ